MIVYRSIICIICNREPRLADRLLWDPILLHLETPRTFDLENIGTLTTLVTEKALPKISCIDFT